jgi:Flp pilus assembly protein TadB
MMVISLALCVLLPTMVHKFCQDKRRLRAREMFQDKLQLVAVAEAERYSSCSQDIYSSTV